MGCVFISFRVAKEKIARIENSPGWSSKNSGWRLNNLNWLFPQPLPWGYSKHKGQHSRCLVKEQFGVLDGGFGAGLCIQEFIFYCDFSFTLIFPIIKEGCGATWEIQSCWSFMRLFHVTSRGQTHKRFIRSVYPILWPVQNYEETLIEKLIQIGLDGKSVMWVGNWLKDCKRGIMINDNVTSLWKVSCRVSGEFVLGLVSSNISINYQEMELNCTGVKFTDNIKREGHVSSSWVTEFTQTGPEQLENCAENNTIFRKALFAFWCLNGNIGSFLGTDPC